MTSVTGLGKVGWRFDSSPAVRLFFVIILYFSLEIATLAKRRMDFRSIYGYVEGLTPAYR